MTDVWKNRETSGAAASNFEKELKRRVHEGRGSTSSLLESRLAETGFYEGYPTNPPHIKNTSNAVSTKPNEVISLLNKEEPPRKSGLSKLLDKFKRK